MNLNCCLPVIKIEKNQTPTVIQLHIDELYLHVLCCFASFMILYIFIIRKTNVLMLMFQNKNDASFQFNTCSFYCQDFKC